MKDGHTLTMSGPGEPSEHLTAHGMALNGK